MKEIHITKTVRPWVFNYIMKPIFFISVLLGITTTLTKSDGSEKIYNASGERWKWLRESTNKNYKNRKI